MIVRLQQLAPEAASHAGHTSYAQQFAERFSLYQDQHSSLMFALWDAAVDLEIFTLLNEDVRRLALDLKTLRLSAANR